MRHVHGNRGQHDRRRTGLGVGPAAQMFEHGEDAGRVFPTL